MEDEQNRRMATDELINVGATAMLAGHHLRLFHEQNDYIGIAKD